MKFKPVYFGYSGFVVSKSEKKEWQISLKKSQPESTDIFFIYPWKRMLCVFIRSGIVYFSMKTYVLGTH